MAQNFSEEELIKILESKGITCSRSSPFEQKLKEIDMKYGKEIKESLSFSLLKKSTKSEIIDISIDYFIKLGR